MKDIKKLKQEMSDITDKIQEHNKLDTKESKSAVRRLKKKLQEVKFCLRYVETEPSEDFIKKERDRIENRINKLMELYVPLDSLKFTKPQITQHKKAYEKEMDIPKIRKQLTVINYLLK